MTGTGTGPAGTVPVPVLVPRRSLPRTQGEYERVGEGGEKDAATDSEEKGTQRHASHQH